MFRSKNSKPQAFNARIDKDQSDNINPQEINSETDFINHLNKQSRFNSKNDYKKKLNKEIVLFIFLIFIMFAILYIFQSLLNQQNFDNI